MENTDGKELLKRGWLKNAAEAKKITEGEHNSEKEKDQRKRERISLIRLVIILCFISSGIFIMITVMDLLFFHKDIYNAPVFIMYITVISTTLTTAVGVVIGSSID